VHKYMRTHGSKGLPNQAGMGLGLSAHAGRPGPLRGSVRPPLFLHPKDLHLQDRESFAPRGHPQARERAWRSFGEKDRSTRRKHPQVEKNEDTVGSVPMIKGAMSSTLMGVIYPCPWVVIDLEM
jgi:hypothetical protein